MVLFTFVNVMAGDFTDNGDGTVTDDNTGLMWQKEDDDTRRNWEAAISYCEDNLSLGGYTDWRLPNIKELESITDYTLYDPAIDTNFFPGTYSRYWSSTTYAYNSSYAWKVTSSLGSVSYDGKMADDFYYVRCVREGGVELVWTDTFESYSSGSFPSDWTPDGNATDGSTNYVDNTVSYEGTKSLRLFGSIGGCWAAIAYHPLIVSPPYEIEVVVRNGNDPLSGCNPDRGSIGIRKGTSWTNPGRHFIMFKGDGTIISAAQNSLGNYTSLTWYTIKIRYERPSPSEVNVSYWINGAYKGTEVLSSQAEEDQMTNLGLTVLEGAAWFDAVKVSQ